MVVGPKDDIHVWAIVLNNLIDRLLITASYSALSQGSSAIKPITTPTKDMFPMVCSLIFLMVAVRLSCVTGLQDTFIMLAAQCFSAGVPLPQEPSGVLVLPSILLYFGMAALIMRYFHQTGSCEDITSKTTQYVVLFVCASLFA